MIKRVILNGILTSILQIVVYRLLLICSIAVLRHYGQLVHPSIGMKISIEFSFMYFVLTVVVVNLLCAFVHKIRFTWLMLALASLCYVYVWMGDYNWLNYKRLFFVTLGLPCLFLKLPIDNVLGKININPNKQ